MATADSESVHGRGRISPGTPAPGDVIRGKYEVQGTVGVGGMGVVLAARHVQLGQSVAIKLLLDDSEEARLPEARARFLREAQAAARLRSDHVVRIYDVDTLESGAPFMVMELLEGEDLARLLDRVGRIPSGVAVDYVIQACHAVEQAHEAGIVHRDLKPSNLFVGQRSNGSSIVKVLDFGISKALSREGELDASLTSTRSVVGSPYYMSPEQVRDAKRVDHRTDIWSLGMILYELLTGGPAYEADTLPAICAAIAADPPPPLRERHPDIAEALEQVVLRCLEKDPNRRYESVRALTEALAPFAPSPSSAHSAPFVPVPRTARVSVDAETIASVDLPDVARGIAPNDSGVRETASLASNAAPTLLSTPAPKPSSRRWLVVAIASAVAVTAGAALTLISGAERPGPPASDPAPAASPPRPFQLTIASEPPGATVMEGGRALGATPLSLPISADSLSREPRRFVLEKPGFLPYTLLQGPSADDVAMTAELAPEPTRATAEPSAPAAPPPFVRSPQPPLAVPAARPARAAPAPAVRAAPPAPDIRLER